MLHDQRYLDARGYHAVNVTLHAASACVLLALLRCLAVPGAWAVALVFALHPMHVESVAWITERKNVLSSLFYLLAVAALWRCFRNQGGTVWRSQAVVSREPQTPSTAPADPTTHKNNSHREPVDKHRIAVPIGWYVAALTLFA